MFLGYIHTFRAIAISFIVAGHCIDVFEWNGADKDIEKIFRITASNGSVLFVFIAGYLFQHLSPRFNYAKYLKAKLNNVLIPYFIVSIPAIFVFVFLLKRDVVWSGFYAAPIWIQVANFYLTGLHLAPYWFIPFITIFYLVSPWLVRADKSKYFYFLMPFFIWITCVTHRGFSNPFASFIHFFSIYTLGMLFSHYKEGLNAWLSKPWLIGLSLFLVVFLWQYEFRFIDEYFSWVNDLQKILLCVFVLGSLIGLGEKATYHALNLIADMSFGIYFVHSYVITAGKLLIKQVYGGLPQPGIGLYFTALAIVLTVSISIVYLIKAVAGSKSRLLVGS